MNSPFSVEGVAKAMMKAGISFNKIVRSSEPQLEDDEIIVTKDVHVQVGPCYLSVVKSNPDGTFLFYPERQTVNELVPDLCKAFEVA